MFDDGLRQAMRRETELFLENIIRNDGSMLELLDANYTFLNERLARFYGIPGVTGPEFRRVDMSGTERGGGILAHASVLTVSSYSTRTSPVLRGKWILENLLNAPPPAPPPGVPPLDDSQGRPVRDAAAADGGASQESGLRLLPLAHGPARLRPGELQRHRRLAHRGRQVSGGCVRRAARWPLLPDARRTEGDSQGRIATSSCAASPRSC